MRLTINSHHDACLISNAVREHGQKSSDNYHYHYIKALEEGLQEDAKKFLQWRKDADLCMNRTLSRLEKIIKKFEDQIDYDQHQKESNGGGGGYSIDNATCYN